MGTTETNKAALIISALATALAISFAAYALGYTLLTTVEDRTERDPAVCKYRIRKVPGGEWGAELFMPASAFETWATGRNVLLVCDK